MRFGIFAASLVVVLALAACSTGGDCLCQLCTPGSSVTVTVVDGSTGGPLTTFLLDVTVNGTPVGEPPSCTEEARAAANTGNSCSFGDDTGLYQLVIGAPGYETREALVRQAEPGGGDFCCRNVCLTSQELTIGLDALEAP